MRAKEFTESARDYGNVPTGPGPQLIPFPQGTTMVDVSDIYDWYKLGMVISDLDDADPRKFNQGAPHTILAFGSEEEEHKMLPLLKRLGLGLHDIDKPEDVQKAYRASDALEGLEENFADVDEGLMGLLIKPAVKKSPIKPASPEEMRQYFAKEKAKDPDTIARGEIDKKAQQVYTKRDENFADGRKPQDKGDAKRHGINTKASVSSLRKTAKQGGRKGQLAHWMANMRSGQSKKK
jgi:hypothetical protein